MAQDSKEGVGDEHSAGVQHRVADIKITPQQESGKTDDKQRFAASKREKEMIDPREAKDQKKKEGRKPQR